jgi:hypothetical protein
LQPHFSNSHPLKKWCIVAANHWRGVAANHWYIDGRGLTPGCRLIADVLSRMAARSATRHPSLKKTGASLGWGIDDPREVEGWAQDIHLIEEWYFGQDPDLDRLSLGYRLAYKLAGAFTVVRRAHRIVYYQL